MDDWLNQVNAVLQSMQKTLECNICLDLLNKPLTTKCGHSFCADCIHQLVKNARNTAQCPLCLCHVTRRSLGQNSKITGLVISVRDIIASIKKDCCFEVTPSKYRPRRQPVVPYEEDDSENEENDEPRRGMRKRAVTSHYNPEVYVPKPRARAAKQRILASSSGQELSLCVDGKTEMIEMNMTPIYGEPSLISCIEKEHSYSSPTKQEPHERSSVGQQIKGQPSRGKGKVSSNAKGKSRALVTKSDKPVVKILHDYTRKDSNDDHLSASQQDNNVLKFDDGILSAKEKPSDDLSNKLGHEKSSDKVAKWICNSSELGFSIGLKQSSESMSTVDSEATHTFQRMNEKESEKPCSSFQKTLGCNDSINPVEMTSKACDVASSHSLSEMEQTSVLSSKPKFFKSKVKNLSAVDPKEFDKKNIQGFDEDDIATVLYEAKPNIRGTPDDPYKFIPSQKTPKQKVQAKRGRSTRGTKSRARGSLNVSRGRVRGRGRGAGTPGQTVLGIRRDSVAEFGLASSTVFHTQSTPAIKGKGNMQDIDISIIKATDVTIEKKVPNESTIVCRRDDDDDDEDCSQIPDSCPVNTKDEFDEVVSGVKERAADLVKGCNVDDSDDEEERHLLFITPAQGDENLGTKDTNTQDKKEAESKTEMIQKKSELERTDKGKPKQRENILSKRKQTSNKLSKSRVENVSNSDVSSRSSNTRHHNNSQRKSAAEKAKAEVDALCALFDDVDKHELSTITLEDDVKQRKSIEKSKEIVMRQNISIHDQTIENTELNKTMPSIIPKPEVSMPPPKAPSRNRKVKFLSSVSNAHSVSSTGDVVTVATSKSERKPLGSRGSGKGKAVKSNVRYGAEAKQKILEPSKVVPKSVSIKDTKSPGWSHVAGARKDLGTRHTSLNITGGEQRNLNDTKAESGTRSHSVRIPSSEESNATIDEETQDNNVEHLQSSQSKIELVKKLKEIVKQLKEVGDGDKKVPEIFEKEIPGDVKELMEQQQEMEDLCMENTISKIDSNEPDTPQNNLQPNYPEETEPFDCSDLVSHPPVKKCTSYVSNVDTLKQKRKAVDSQPTQSVRPSKLARKTFSLEEKSTISSHSDNPHESSVKPVEKSKIDSRYVERNHVDAPSAVSESPHSQISDDHLSGISIDLKSKQKDAVMASRSQSSMDSSEVPSTEVDTVDRISSCSEQVSGSFVFPHNKKNCIPPHAMSSSVATTTTAQGHCSGEGTTDYTFTSVGVNHVLDANSRVIPFRSVGSLYTKRCGTSSENAQQSRLGGGLGRDLCLHSIPCELYHVLLKYVNVLAAQKQQQSGCCSNLPSIECEEAPYAHSEGTLKSDTDENKIIGNNTHLQQRKSTVDENVQIDTDENKPANDEIHNLDSEVPNSCDTEELEMAIPLPQAIIVKMGSIRKKGMDDHSKEQVSRNTGNELVCSQKIDKIADSYSIPLHKNLTGVDARNCEDNDNDQSKSEISSVGTRAGRAKSKSSGQPTECVASATSIESRSIRSSQGIPVVDNVMQKNPKQVDFEGNTSCERDIEKDSCQGVDEYIPSSCEIGSSQKSTSLLSAAEMSNIKVTKSNRSSSMGDISDGKADEKSGKSDRSQQNQRNREKNVSAKTVMSVGDVEKENLKNGDNLQVNINRPKRKPLQSGPPDLENIMSHVIKGSKSPLDEKIESSQIQRQLSQASLKSSSQRPINSRSLAPNTLNQSNRSFKEGTSFTDKNLNIIEDIEVLDSRNSLRADGGSPQRKFTRIKRPVSGSSSEDSDSEGSSAKTKKRRLKGISSSSGTSLSAKVTTSETNGDQHQTQHILDSDEMRDMERFDQNVWDYFGHPDKDLEIKEKNEGLHVMKDSSQPDKVELIPSDEEIPSTADVMRNVEADLALISKMRQNKEDSQLTINLASQDTDQTSQSTKDPSLSVNTRSLFKKVDKSLTAAENLLEGEDSLFQDLCTPSLEKKGTDIRKLDVVEKSKSASRDGNATKGDCNEKVVAESDEESEGDLDNVSHSSAHSSQSEAICTQRQQEVQSEVEILRAKIRELEAEKKGISKQDSDAAVNQKKSPDSEDELFPSLPDFNASTEPSLPPSNRPGNSTRLPTKSAPVSVREACCLVCTGLNGSETMKVNDFIKSLAPAGSSIQKAWGTGITHVVVKTDKDMLAQRTLKYLFGVASGCWVVSLQWIIDSISAKKILEESDYEVLDCTGIPGPRRGRTYFKPLFDNFEFFLKPPFVEVTIGQLKDLLELCGAKFASSPSGFSKSRGSTKLVIIQTDSSHDAEGYLKKYQKISVTHDWIIECVGMHSHVCITPYIVGNPKQSHYTSSGIPAILLEESQDLTCSQLP